jgi:hypothetical protein
MIWAILILAGVPLWLCALGILVLLYRNRSLRKRHGDIPVRVLRPGKRRWSRGHAVWVSEVFAWRGSPAAWHEDLELIVTVSLRDPTTEDIGGLHRLGGNAVVATLTSDNGTVLHVATAPEHRASLLGPFTPQVESAGAQE